MRILTSVLALFSFAALAQNSAQTLTNDDVIKMSRSGLNETLVLDLIREKPSNYQSDPGHLVALRQAGVSESLVNEIVRKNPVPDPLNTENIIALSRAGFGSGFLVNLIHYQLGRYSIDSADLKRQGLSDDVIAAMAEKPGIQQSRPVEPPAPPVPATGLATRPEEAPVAAAKRFELAAGTFIPVRLIDRIDSKLDNPGDSFKATVAEDIRQDSEIVIPRGSAAVVRLAGEKDTNRVVGRTVLTVELVSVSVGSRKVTVVTDTIRRESESRTGQTAKRTAIGAGAGAILGAIFGGGKGAAVGAGVGGGAGAGSEAMKKAPTVTIPSETVLTFRTSGPTLFE